MKAHTARSASGHLGVALLIVALPTVAAGGPAPVDLSGYRPDCGVTVKASGPGERGSIIVHWPIAERESGRLVLNTEPGEPLLESVTILASPSTGPAHPNVHTLLRQIDPVYFLTVGTRNAPPGRPPGMSVFNVFFDSPAQRPHRTVRSTLETRRVRVTSEGHRASLIFDSLKAGPFAGALHITVYRGCPLIHVEAVVSTSEPNTAYFYETGLAARGLASPRFAWIDTEGRLQRATTETDQEEHSLAVRHRLVVAETEQGSIACFPPPHQFFFARDLTDNLKYAWFGRNHRQLDDRFGFGIRQAESGGGSFVPWYNAPPGTEQRLGAFYLLSRGDAQTAITEALRFTHGDRFPELPGYSTFTSHWHMEIALASMKEREQGGHRTIPDLVRMFKEMGVNIVHLAEFHGPGHQQDPGPLRWPEMAAMFDECQRLSDDELLLLPGEEISGILGVSRPQQHPGHWMCLFPRPVYWAMKRDPGAPFSEQVAPYGKVYRVRGREDMVRLLQQEHGLAWTSHPRIKASSWAPDAFRETEYYKAAFWLGAAWKAMPVDLSRPKLGERALDLLDDMNNWGPRKQLVGEVDVFKIDHTHELYGHMNINYLRLVRRPRFGESWQPVLGALRGGRFFVTTGEVLIREFRVGGKESGDSLAIGSSDRPEITLDLDWTFPLRFAEIVSGDGSRVYRERIDLADTGPFGRRRLSARPELHGRTWVRAEAWDIAGDGAFTQPVWLENGRHGRPPAP